MARTAIFILLTTFLLSLTAQAKTDRDVALIFKVKGKVNVVKPDKSKKAARRGLRLDAGDRVETDANGFTALIFTDDKSMMKIRANSDVVIRGKRIKKSFAKRIYMEVGQAWVHVSPQVASDFRIETPTGVAAVKGTEFYTIVDQMGNMTIIATKGIVELMNQLGRVLVHAGEAGHIEGKEQPKVRNVKPDEIPGWGKQKSAEEGNVLEIEFEDQNGAKKHLKIRYKEK
jgi:hypothetical protein